MNQKGIVHLQLIIVIALVISAISFTGIKILHKNTAKVAPVSKPMPVLSKKPGKTATPPASNSSSTPSTTSSQTTSSTTSTTQPSAPATSTQTVPTASSTQPSSTSSESPQPSPDTSSSTTPAVPGPPTIGNLTPANGATVTGNELTFDCSYTTPAGFSKLVISTVDQNGQDAHTGGEQDIGSAGCWSQGDSTYLPDGQYTSTFTVYDVNGKTASASTTYTISH